MENRPLNLGDILEKVFVIAGKSFSRNIIVAAIIMLPAAIILSIGLTYFFNQLVEFTISRTYQYEYDFDYYNIINFVLAYIATIFSAALLQMAGYLGTSYVFQKQYTDEKATISEAFNVIFSSKLVELIIFSMIVVMAVLVLIGIPITLLSIGAAAELYFLSFLGGLLLIAVILFAIWLSIKWLLFIPVMVTEDCGIIEALKRSSHLVKYSWWRTFGIYILISFIVQIALSIITTPLGFIIFLDFFISIISSASNLGHEFNDPHFFLNYLSGMGYKIGMVSWVTYVAQLCILPCIQVIMYFDLRARKKSLNSADFQSEQDIDLTN
jgi:hypothetical protein